MVFRESALSFEKVTFSYGNSPVLSDVNFSVPGGEFLVIIGPNGGGKTTLLKLALGLLAPDQGKISIFGKNPGEDPTAAGYVPQDAGLSRDFPITALEVVLQGRIGGAGGGWRYGKKDREAAYDALESMGMAHGANRTMGLLSQGQRQRVLIARSIASAPRLLMLDEPLASIDAESRDSLMAWLAGLKGKMTVVMVSHDMSVISGHATAVACVNRQVFYHGSAEIVPEMVETAYGSCPVELIAHGIPHRVLAVHDHDHGEETHIHD